MDIAILEFFLHINTNTIVDLGVKTNPIVTIQRYHINGDVRFL